MLAELAERQTAVFQWMSCLRPNGAVNHAWTRVPTDYVSKDYSVLPPVGQQVTYSSVGSLRSPPGYPPLIPLADAAFCCRTRNFRGLTPPGVFVKRSPGGMLACVTPSRISPDGRDRRRQYSSPIWLDAAVRYLGRRPSDAVIRRGEFYPTLLVNSKTAWLSIRPHGIVKNGLEPHGVLTCGYASERREKTRSAERPGRTRISEAASAVRRSR